MCRPARLNLPCQRNLYKDTRPVPVPTLNIYGPAQPSNQLLNSLQSSLKPEFVRWDVLRVKADAPVLDLNAEALVVLPQPQQHVPALAMATGVEQQFLHDGEYRGLQSGRRSAMVKSPRTRLLDRPSRLSAIRRSTAAMRLVALSWPRGGVPN